MTTPCSKIVLNHRISDYYCFYRLDSRSLGAGVATVHVEIAPWSGPGAVPAEDEPRDPPGGGSLHRAPGAQGAAESPIGQHLRDAVSGFGLVALLYSFCQTLAGPGHGDALAVQKGGGNSRRGHVDCADAFRVEARLVTVDTINGVNGIVFL